MTTPLDNNNTSYKPFAKSNVDVENNNEIPTLSAIDEESIKRTSLLQLKEKLANVPHADKSTLVYAQVVTDIVNDDHLLGFLYVENYNVDLALKRLLRYWDTRHKVFGDDYILPLTLYGAMKDKVDVLKKGVLVLLPEPDDRGRAIIYTNLSLLGDDDTAEKMIQLWWYLIHCAMERPSCRKNGFVVINNAQDVRIRHLDTKMWLAFLKSGETTFPVRRQASHVCNPHNFFRVASVMKAMTPLRSRQLMTLHYGSSNRVLESLAANSLPARVVPTTIGGSFHLSLEELVAARLAVEGQRDNIMSKVSRSNISQDGNISDVSFDGDHLGNAFMGLEEGVSDSKPSYLPPASSSLTNPFVGLELEGISDFSIVADQQQSDTTAEPNSSMKSQLDGLDSKPSSLPPQNDSSSYGTLPKTKGRKHDPLISPDGKSYTYIRTNPTERCMVYKCKHARGTGCEAMAKRYYAEIPERTEFQGIHNAECDKVRAKKKIKAMAKPAGCEMRRAQKKAAHRPRSSSSNGTTKKFPGRSGDERMNKAVAAKRHDPNMSLLDAVLAGGFVFPNMNAPGVKLAEAKDLDGVSVHQRKNQLMRRLRTKK